MLEEPAPAALLEKLCGDQRRRWQAGERIPAEAYVRQHPGLESEPQHVLELVYNEVLLREESGEEPRLEEYVRRFPRFVPQLKPLFEVHRALASGGPLEPGGTGGPGATPPETGVPAARPGPALGDYAILAELGRGGMGVVYEARQLSLNRVVALKMILGGQLASGADVQRFRAEAEAAANLDHPHIVPVYEVGEQDGRHYFSMKLVQGISLAQAVNRGPWAVGRQGAERRAARVVEAVARAVHYAHQRGILHRDLKPANILLDEQGQPHVTDFGLARRVEGGSSLTPSGAIVGTPGYMAPEQASGRKGGMSTACDVYSLGAILYELLTGGPPFRGETPLATLRLVQERQPQRPRAVNARVSRDLETICLKCLHKEPQQRYATANDLADDLSRYLAGEPIRGRPVGPAERLWWWCRRRPLVAGLSAALVLMCGLGFGGVLWQWRRAEGQRAVADGQRRLAEENSRQAQQAVDDYFTKVSESKLLKVPGFQPLRKELLETALAYYQRFLEERGADPLLQAETAAAHARVAQITGMIGSPAEALAEYQKARVLYERLADADPGRSEFRHALARIHDDSATLLQSMDGRRAEAAASARRALALREAIARENPGNTDYQHSVAVSHLNLGNLLSRTGRYAEALRSYEQARAAFAPIAKPGQAYGNWGLAKTYHAIGFAHSRLGQYPEALRSCERARALFETVARLDPGDTAFPSDLAYTCTFLGDLHASGFRRPDQALSCYERARTLLTKLVEENPEVTEYRQRLALCWLTIGEQYKTARPAEALRACEEARGLLDKLTRTGSATPDIQDLRAGCYTNIGELQHDTGAYAAAAASHERARDIRQRLVSLNPDCMEYRNNLAVTFHHLGEARWHLGRREESLACYRQAAEHQRQAFLLAPQVPQLRLSLSTLYRKLARRQRELRRPAEAAATALLRRQLWPRHPDELYDVACELALCLPLVGKEPTALTAGEQAERRGYALQAMDTLRQAVAHGFNDREHLRKDPDLEPLRARDDFSKLLDDPGQKPKTGLPSLMP
jgi:serine/threonine protein kinase